MTQEKHQKESTTSASLDESDDSNPTTQSATEGDIVSLSLLAIENDEVSIPEKILESAEGCFNGLELDITLEDNEDILHSLSELTPILENERSYFILGKYDRKTMRHLNLVAYRLNRRSDAFAFRMVDIRGKWENLIVKFCLIADLVTCIVGIAEEDGSGFDTEIGLLLKGDYFPKSHLLKQESDEELFNTMAVHFFEIFGEVGRLYPWQSEDELASMTEELP